MCDVQSDFDNGYGCAHRSVNELGWERERARERRIMIESIFFLFSHYTLAPDFVVAKNRRVFWFNGLWKHVSTAGAAGAAPRIDITKINK